MKHAIDVGSTKPIKQKYYPVSQKLEEEMHKLVEEMLVAGIIEPSTSGWSSPVAMVRKSNGKFRFCVDLRKVNAASKPDAYPLPFMKSISRQLQKAQYISTLDLSSAYHQIPLHPESKEMTAFTVAGKELLQFTRMPYGLLYAEASFQRLIDKAIGPDHEPFAYLGDIIIVTETLEEHKEFLKRVLDSIKDGGLTINREKSVFCRNEVQYEVVVNRDCFKPDPE